MKAEEMMLYDWFLCFGKPTHWEAQDFQKSDEFIAEHYKPIELIPDILEKNGFYKDWDNKTYLMGELFRLTSLTDGMEYYLNKWFSMQIYYVHTLQHALRLCGLNELANNFKI